MERGHFFFNETQEENNVNKGVILRDTKMCVAASGDAACIWFTKEGVSMQIISVLSHFVIIKHDDIYAYLPNREVQFNTDYEKQFVHIISFKSSYDILITKGEIYEQASDLMMKVYLKVRDKVEVFLKELDMAGDAYVPYRGYHGVG